jgi:hypothetical protein
MKTMWQCVSVIVLISTALVGYASMASNGGAGDSATRDNVDWKQVNAVDSVARRAGVDVHWVNYPLKTQP